MISCAFLTGGADVNLLRDRLGAGLGEYTEKDAEERIRVCYGPNLGYGRFGSKVTMDNSPWFDNSDQFDQRRIRLADTDGSGTTDILYLRRDSVQVYFNQSGNCWSNAVLQFPSIDNIASVQALDLLGNGTACLVWSSPPVVAQRPMRYLALMEEKPYLLIGITVEGNQRLTLPQAIKACSPLRKSVRQLTLIVTAHCRAALGGRQYKGNL